MIPLSNVLLVLFFIASAFAALEHPSYQALIADLTDPSERERAYSLSYLGNRRKDRRANQRTGTVIHL